MLPIEASNQADRCKIDSKATAFNTSTRLSSARVCDTLATRRSQRTRKRQLYTRGQRRLRCTLVHALKTLAKPRNNGEHASDVITVDSAANQKRADGGPCAPER